MKRNLFKDMRLIEEAAGGERSNTKCHLEPSYDNEREQVLEWYVLERLETPLTRPERNEKARRRCHAIKMVGEESMDGNCKLQMYYYSCQWVGVHQNENCAPVPRNCLKLEHLLDA